MELENRKHEMFCREYLEDLNATQAYLRVYVDASSESARRLGSTLLTNIDVGQRISDLMEERKKRVQITIDEVLQDLIDVKNICLEREKEVEVGTDGFEKETGKTVFKDKMMVNSGIKSVELLGRHIGMWNDKKPSEEALETIEAFVNRIGKE